MMQAATMLVPVSMQLDSPYEEEEDLQETKEEGVIEDSAILEVTEMMEAV